MTKTQPKPGVEESSRMWASASFVGVLIVVGLPLWWKTTEVYRVSLPYDKIGKFNSLSHSIYAELTILAQDDSTADELAINIQKAFQDSNLIKLKITKSSLSPQLRESVDAIADEQEAVEEVASAHDLTRHNHLYLVQRAPLFQQVWVGGDRVVFFRDSKALVPLISALKQWLYPLGVLEGARSDAADVPRRTRLPPDAGYHVVLSVVHPRPDRQRVHFDATAAVEDYIGTFVDELSLLHNFTLKSQWLHLLDFDFQAKEMKEIDSSRHYAVRADRLPQLLTRLEGRAATHVSDLPTVNLALYVVPCQRAPLIIYQADKKVSASVQAFMSPKWGGVVLGNPTSEECASDPPTYTPDRRAVMGTFISQLRKLLGITDTDLISGAHLEPLRSVAPRKWEIDNLLRIRTLEQLTSAERTLQSLAQLLGEISNIVINDDVGASINSAVESIHLANDLMASGDLVGAYRTSQRAFLAAETAFMEPSLLALLYFPDDQKYAIYIPLFLPIMVPVVLSLKNLVVWLRGRPVHTKID